MLTRMRPRYYCEHCRKGSGSPGYMKRHERGCTANPHRVCGMCAMVEQEGYDAPAPPRDELLRVLDADGFAAMCEAAHNCPACILSALRERNNKHDDGEAGWQPRVSGPDDGRNEWDYKKAKNKWWAEWNDARADDQDRDRY